MDWIAATCWAVIALAGLWVLWALFWDRPRGRLRCRKCAYDMAGGGLTCPECGKTHASARALRRTRRRLKTAVAGVVFGSFAAHSFNQRRELYVEGPIGFLPTYSLLLIRDRMTLLPASNGNVPKRPYGVQAAIEHRIVTMRMSKASRIFLARQLAQELARDNATLETHVVDLSHLIPMSSYQNVIDKFRSPNIDPPALYEHYAIVIPHFSSYVEGIVYHYVGHENQYTTAFVWDQLVFAGTRDGCDDIRRFVEHSRSNLWSPGDPVGGLGFESEERVLVLYDVSQWKDILGERASTSVVTDFRVVFNLMTASRSVSGTYIDIMPEDRIAVVATPEQHREYMTYLSSRKPEDFLWVFTD